MYRRLILIGIVTIISFLKANAQKDSLFGIKDELFFHALSSQPDSIVKGFLKRYCPVLLKRPEPGSWTSYPPGPIPVTEDVVHSLVFYKHPYFKAKFREGAFELDLREDSAGFAGIRNMRVWFVFDSKIDASAAFSLLCRRFDKVSRFKKIYLKEGRRVAEYAESRVPKEMRNDVQFILMPHEIYPGKYKLLVNMLITTYSEYDQGT